MKPFFTIIILLQMTTSIVLGQNGYYWSQNYGLKSSLVSGASVAGSDDNGTLYYNPATAVNDSKAKFSLSGFGGTYTIFKHINGGGEMVDFKAARFDLAPKLVATTFKPFKKSEKTFVYFGVFKKGNYNLDFTGGIDIETDAFPEQDGLENIRGSFRYLDIMRETWVTFGTAYAINDKLSVGGGIYMTFVNRNYEFSWSKIIQNSNDDLLAYIDERVYLTHSMKFNMFSKVGATFQNNGYKIGITLTTPTFGSFIDKANYNYSLEKKAITDSVIQFDYKINNDLAAKYKLPLSMALGVEIPIKNFKYSFAVEYFFRIKEYDFVYDKNDDTNNLGLKNYAKGVINAAIGIHYQVPDKNMDFLAGFRTNFNAKRGQNTETLDYLRNYTGNIYYASFGSIFKLKEHSISIGVEYGFAPNKNEGAFVDLSSNDINSLDPNAISSNLKLNLISFSMGFELGLKEKDKDKLEE